MPDLPLAPSEVSAWDHLQVWEPPSANFDLRHWKLTLPSGDEISTVVLNSGYAHAEAFYTDRRTGGLVFRSPNIAGTTRNSQYSRSELREMREPEGPANAKANNWTTAEGGSLRATLRIDHVSTTGEPRKVGRVVIGQIHGEGAEPVRLYYEKRPTESTGRIYAGMDSASNRNSWSPDIVSNDAGGGIALGEVFTYEIRLSGLELMLQLVTEDGLSGTYRRTIDPGYQGTRLYFKAGVYNQNDTGDVSDYVQATFFNLRVVH